VTTAQPIGAEDARTVAEGLAAWLSSGACQSPAGAFYAWVDEGSGRPAFEYPEITGYALTHFAGRQVLSGDSAEAAQRAGAWLAERIGAGRLSARDGWDDGAIYNFDLGIISNGLFALGSRLGNTGWIDAGRSLAESIAKQVPTDGCVPALDVTASSRSGWSVRGTAHMIKVVQCLLAADLARAARALCSCVAGLQQPDGRMVTDPGDDETMVHPHLYAVEGLWMYGEATADEDARERARRGVEWAFAHQLPSGGLPRHVDTDGNLGDEQLDATAQAIRAAVLTGFQPAGFDAAFARLLECARPAGVGLAMPYQPTSGAKHSNAWVTMFALQAIELTLSGERLPWHLLV
jgi:hypothetical protein